MQRIRTKVRYKLSFAFRRADNETARILKNDKVLTTEGCHAIMKFPFTLVVCSRWGTLYQLYIHTSFSSPHMTEIKRQRPPRGGGQGRSTHWILQNWSYYLKINFARLNTTSKEPKTERGCMVIIIIIIIIIIISCLLITIAVKKNWITVIKYKLQKFTLFNNAIQLHVYYFF